MDSLCTAIRLSVDGDTRQMSTPPPGYTVLQPCQQFQVNPSPCPVVEEAAKGRLFYCNQKVRFLGVLGEHLIHHLLQMRSGLLESRFGGKTVLRAKGFDLAVLDELIWPTDTNYGDV